MVIDAGLFEKVVINVLKVKTYSDLQKEALWVVMNATTEGNEKQALQVRVTMLDRYTQSPHAINSSALNPTTNILINVRYCHYYYTGGDRYYYAVDHSRSITPFGATISSS